MINNKNKTILSINPNKVFILGVNLLANLPQFKRSGNGYFDSETTKKKRFKYLSLKPDARRIFFSQKFVNDFIKKC